MLVTCRADSDILGVRKEDLAAQLLDVETRIDVQLSKSRYVSPTLQDLLDEEIQLENDEDALEASLIDTLKELKANECRVHILSELEAERDRWLAAMQDLLQNQPTPPSGMGNRPVFLPLPPDRQGANLRPSRRSSTNSSVQLDTPEQMQVFGYRLYQAPESVRIPVHACMRCMQASVNAKVAELAEMIASAHEAIDLELQHFTESAARVSIPLGGQHFCVTWRVRLIVASAGSKGEARSSQHRYAVDGRKARSIVCRIPSA
jgi:hypothetical protein